MTKNIDLEYLECSFGELDSLDLQFNLKLKTVKIQNNRLKSINIGVNNSLDYLDCSTNELTKIDNVIAPKLSHLNCSSNNLNSIYLSDLVALEYLNCSNNRLKEIDLSMNSTLTQLNCENNLLTLLNLKNVENNILWLNAQNNMPICIQVDDVLAADNNSAWYKDDWSHYSEDCAGNIIENTFIPDDNFEQALIDLGYDKDGINDSVPTAIVKTLTHLDINDMKISDLTGIEDFTSLTRLWCANNHISELNLDNNPSLVNIDVNNNKLSSLDVSHCQNLTFLSCGKNQLDEINVSQNIKLGRLLCNENNVTNIDISQNPLIYYLRAQYNNLSNLNLKNGNNENLQIIVTNNPNLLCIQVDDPVASESYSNWEKDEQASYSEDCNPSVAEIPAEEYNSLVDLYQSTVGDEWTNNTNWLDTTTCLIDDWYGITVENGHVTQIELSKNNLQEGLSSNRVLLPELKVLDISNNILDFANFNSFDSLSKLQTLKIENNRFLFKHIQPVFYLPKYEQLAAGFTYSPQAKIDIPENVEIPLNQNYSFSISEYYISPNDQFQWYKDGTKLEGETGSTIEFLPVTKSDSGSYWLQITNPGVPDLTLYSNYKTLYVNSPGGAGVPISEYNALVDFYNSLHGENWTRNDNWLDTINSSVGEWFGITVKNGHVTEIYFSPYDIYNLKGSIPNSIKDLPHLESFMILTDNVSGELPAGLFELTNLKTLYLSECNISGTLPAEIRNLKNLEILGLEANKLEGSIPTEIGNLTNLKFLSFYENKLSGGIPPSLGQLTNLEYLALAYNQLTGTIPPAIGNLTNIKWLLLDNNELTGPLPVELAQLTNALKISLDNNIIGEMQDSLKSENLKSTQTDNNRQIPDELAGLLQMDTLYLGGNKLQFNDIEAIFSWENFNEFNDFIYYPQDSVGINKSIHKTANENLSLSISNYHPGPSDQYQWYKNGVKIPGAISAQLSLSNLQTADSGRYHCKITNPVASELTLFSRINSLAVEPAPASAGVPLSEYKALAELYHSTQGPNWKVNTNWLDTINCEVKDWANIQVVDGHVTNLYLDSNNVAGVLPDELVNLTYLEGLHLFGNSITGEIPQEIGKLTRLLYFSLSHNSLTGEIPESLFQIKNLYLLHLTHNNMEGNIPAEIANLTNLESLSLDHNNLGGSIPPEIGNLTKLRHLNLSHNALTGVIPVETGNLTELRSLNLSNNFLEGPVPAELNNLTKAYRIDIENNLIGNSEPEEKSGFVKNGLVDNNRQIPDELAGLLQIDTLYLGGNKLQFNDIEAIFSWNNYSEFEDFIYAPQDSVGWSKTLEGETGHELTIELNNYFPGPSDQYQWYKNGEILNAANNSSFFIENLAEADSGKYVCKITNPVAAELTLYSREIKLAVTKSTGITTVAQNVVSVYPNPAAGRLFLDVQNRAANLEIFNATGNLVRAFPDITNGWIDVNDFRKGIYLFKIRLKEGQTIFKKVIIRN